MDIVHNMDTASATTVDHLVDKRITEILTKAGNIRQQIDDLYQDCIPVAQLCKYEPFKEHKWNNYERLYDRIGACGIYLNDDIPCTNNKYCHFDLVCNKQAAKIIRLTLCPIYINDEWDSMEWEIKCFRGNEHFIHVCEQHRDRFLALADEWNDNNLPTRSIHKTVYATYFNAITRQWISFLVTHHITVLTNMIIKYIN